MFEEVGHHVEKIRRVGYGPLVLDVEPGRFRELTLEEVESLRRAASGKAAAKAAEPARKPMRGAIPKSRHSAPKSARRPARATRKRGR
jgi:23S rRNA pseudouridine2605 synthase